MRNRKNWKILDAKRSIRMCKKTGNPDIQDKKSEISKKLENPETKEKITNIRKDEKTGKS